MQAITEFMVVLATMAQFEVELPPSQVHCMAQNIYHEARGEPISGQFAVAQVVLNRVNNPRRYPDTVCEVVYQTKVRKGKKIAQFSWVTDEPVIDIEDPVEQAAFAMAVEVAIMEMHNYVDRIDGAQYYYNPNKADPRWAAAMTEIKVIGNHRFMSH